MDTILCFFLEKYLRRTLREHKHDQFMALEKGGMSMAASEQSSMLCLKYAAQLVTTKEEMIRLFIRGQNF